MLPIRGVVDQLFDDGPERSAKRGQHAHPKKISLQAYSSTALLVVVAVTAVVAVAVAMGHDLGALPWIDSLDSPPLRRAVPKSRDHAAAAARRWREQRSQQRHDAGRGGPPSRHDAPTVSHVVSSPLPIRGAALFYLIFYYNSAV